MPANSPVNSNGKIVTAGCEKVVMGDCLEGTVHIWDVTKGKELAVLRGHAGNVNSAQFSPDGKYIVTASKDGTARIYLVQLEDLLALAKTRAMRELTCEERIQYLHEDRACPTPTPLPTPTS